MPRQLKVEGFVLKKKRILNADTILTIFTKEMGKMSAVAKGVRTMNSRRAAHLQTGNLVAIELSETGSGFYVGSSSLKSGFLTLRTEALQGYVYLALFILDKILPPQQQELRIYELTRRFVVSLSQTTTPKAVFQDYIQNLMQTLGYYLSGSNLESLLDDVEKNIEVRLPRHVIIG
ncbi:MAG: DNA repair protein RecO [Weeksellaceae bacterium]